MCDSSASSYSEPTNCKAQVDQPWCPPFLCHLEGVNNIFFGVQRGRKAMYLAYFPAQEREERLSFAAFPLPEPPGNSCQTHLLRITHSCHIFVKCVVLGTPIGSEEEQENRTHMVLPPVRFMPNGK